MSQRNKFAFALICMGAMLSAHPAAAHAALVEAQTAQAIRLHAVYDTGAPMSHAQVIIFAPDDPARPWGQGVTDRDGRYDFIPDATEGRWSVQVRHAGHGAIVHVNIGENMPMIVRSSVETGWLNRLLMVVLVAWGALGTALFAVSRSGRRDASA